MSGRRKLYLLALVILVLPSLSSRAHACTCGMITPCESYAAASNVFVGLVTKVEIKPSEGRPPPDAMSTTFTSASPVTRFRVEESFLGGEHKEVEVYGGGTTCDFNFEAGERYLVYAYRSREGQRLYTSICTRTSFLSQPEVAEDLRYLRDLIRIPSGGAVFGNVARVTYKSGHDEPTSAPLPKVKVIFESGGQKLEAVTDGNGDFNLIGLARGRYEIRTEPETNDSSASTDLKEPRTRWELDVPDHGCVRVWFSDSPAGEIIGEVYDNAGLFAKDVEVELIPADQAATTSNLRSVAIDEGGRFRFTFLPPGRYFLGFNMVGGPNLIDPYAEYYFPGVTERAKATIITLKEGQKLAGLKMPLALRAGERMVEGMAVWPDGRAADGVWIELNNPRTGYREGNGDKTDTQGRFAIKAIDGQTYELSARIQVGTPLVNSKPVVIRVGKVGKPIKLVIEPSETRPRSKPE